jgi:hypothetical protein
MAISLHDISVANYLQVLGSMTAILDNGAAYAKEHDLDTAKVEETRLYDDMLPFRFQVISVVHHSLGAINGIKEGVFSPPPSLDSDYAALQDMVKDAFSQLQSMPIDDIEALAGKAMKFKMGDFEIPFTAENFILSFSLPNLYFHATTAYDILRMAGVPLGKRDFLGDMRMGA